MESFLQDEKTTDPTGEMLFPTLRQQLVKISSPRSGRGLIYSHHKIWLGAYFSQASQQQKDQ